MSEVLGQIRKSAHIGIQVLLFICHMWEHIQLTAFQLTVLSPPPNELDHCALSYPGAAISDSPFSPNSAGKWIV